jgi:hypothetical protein
MALSRNCLDGIALWGLQVDPVSIQGGFPADSCGLTFLISMAYAFRRAFKVGTGIRGSCGKRKELCEFIGAMGAGLTRSDE